MVPGKGRAWRLALAVLAAVPAAAWAAPQDQAITTPRVAAKTGESCTAGPSLAAIANTESLHTLIWSPFGRPELGWEVYAPVVAHEIATTCTPETPGFAAALARWQGAHQLPATGILDEPSFALLNATWQARRPYVALRKRGTCPPPPAPEALTVPAPKEAYLGKPILLRATALAAYRRMAAAARAAVPELKADPRWLTIFSGFRDPAADDLRCATQSNCQGVTRAACSAHRTGLALDIYVGQAPGLAPDSSADLNRRALVRTRLYAWLLANAPRYGFVNYVFEPWHWEWTGERP
jgi:D-alanyl-D-alanine carboxypeptidase